MLERRRIGVRRYSRVALAVVGVFSAAAWTNFGQFLFSQGAIHHHELFHYYLGSKYFAELGYSGLYDCVSAVEIEEGGGNRVAARWIRDLATNRLSRGPDAIERAAGCRARFESGRWRQFTQDVGWFRDRLDEGHWRSLFLDHGYNATPVWSLAGTALSNTGPASATQIAWLVAIDPLLLIATAAIVWWAFGWEVLCVALIWFGTNYPARYNYVGGAFLRHDWLFLAIAGLCLARKGFMAAAGFAIGWSALLRLFPALIAVGLVLQMMQHVWRVRRVSLAPAHARFAAGALAACAVLAPLSFVGAGARSGPEVWREFVQNTQKHLSTPFTNHVGLPVIVAFNPSERIADLAAPGNEPAWDTWKDARRRSFADRQWVYVALVVGFLVILGAAVLRQESWIALVLGVGAIPIVAELASYYYSVLLALALLWPRSQLAGIGVAFLAFASAVTPALLEGDDERFALISLAVVALVFAITFQFAWSTRRSGDDTATAES
jgi:hypothetical protein